MTYPRVPLSEIGGPIGLPGCADHELVLKRDRGSDLKRVVRARAVRDESDGCPQHPYDLLHSIDIGFVGRGADWWGHVMQCNPHPPHYGVRHCRRRIRSSVITLTGVSLESALLGVIALVIIGALTGVVLVARQGRARQASTIDAVDPTEIGSDRLGDSVTIVQFSTEFCARCPATRRVLSAITDDTPGAVFVEVDLTHRTDLATRFHVLQTPTTLLLDEAGVIRTRFGGPVTRPTVERELTLITGGSHART